MWRAMGTDNSTFMRPLKHFLTYSCWSLNDWRPILGGEGGFNTEEETSRWAKIWEDESSSLADMNPTPPDSI